MEKAESNFAPLKVLVEEIGDSARVTLTENVILVDRDGQAVYTYDKYQLVVRNRPKLKDSVKANFAEWITEAKSDPQVSDDTTVSLTTIQRIERIEKLLAIQ